MDVLKAFDDLFEPSSPARPAKFDANPPGDYLVTVQSVMPKKSPTGSAIFVWKWRVDSCPNGGQSGDSEYSWFIRNQLGADILGRGLASLGFDMKSKPFSEAVMLALPGLANMKVSLRLTEKIVGDKSYKNVYILGRARDAAPSAPTVNAVANDGHDQEDCPF
jgi:hypothetical protein